MGANVRLSRTPDLIRMFASTIGATVRLFFGTRPFRTLADGRRLGRVILIERSEILSGSRAKPGGLTRAATASAAELDSPFEGPVFTAGGQRRPGRVSNRMLAVRIACIRALCDRGEAL
jgi:hypothetical protein